MGKKIENSNSGFLGRSTVQLHMLQIKLTFQKNIKNLNVVSQGLIEYLVLMSCSQDFLSSLPVCMTEENGGLCKIRMSTISNVGLQHTLFLSYAKSEFWNKTFYVSYHPQNYVIKKIFSMHNHKIHYNMNFFLQSRLLWEHWTRKWAFWKCIVGSAEHARTRYAQHIFFSSVQ